jgi:hypothetical protein
MTVMRKCRDCKKVIDPTAEGDLSPVQHTNGHYYHKDCLELAIWRKSSEHAKPRRRGKAGHACNGRIIRSARGLG